MWIPSYIGLPSNESADQVANTALALPRFSKTLIFPSDLRSYTRRGNDTPLAIFSYVPMLYKVYNSTTSFPYYRNNPVPSSNRTFTTHSLFLNLFPPEIFCIPSPHLLLDSYTLLPKIPFSLFQQ